LDFPFFFSFVLLFSFLIADLGTLNNNNSPNDTAPVRRRQAGCRYRLRLWRPYSRLTNNGAETVASSKKPRCKKQARKQGETGEERFYFHD